jgi:hypothetical protein
MQRLATLPQEDYIQAMVLMVERLVKDQPKLPTRILNGKQQMD